MYADMTAITKQPKATILIKIKNKHSSICVGESPWFCG